MESIIIFFVGWFLVSIPSSLMIGAYLARRNGTLTEKQTMFPATRYAAVLETSEVRAL